MAAMADHPILDRDGAIEAEFSGGTAVGLSWIVSVPPGLTVGAGSTISVLAGSASGRAWGYLVDA